MIKNLPDSINADVVSRFDIGEAEALDDELLWDCYCDIFPIREFLKGRKDILLGNKGAGKTAVFRLLKEKKICFYNEKGLKQIIVPIDESVEYLSISSKLTEAMKTSIESGDTKYRFLWEVYILYRITVILQEGHKIQDDHLLERLSALTDFFKGSPRKPTLLEFLSSTKKTAGFKLDYTNPALPMPDFYISTEPSSSGAPIEDSIDVRTINIDELKNLLNSYLRKHKRAVFVLVDNVDDFIAREGYQVQKEILQGLVQCSKSYSRHPYIKVKLFLRNDLFHKLNFSQLGGYDKVSPRTIHLQWNNSDIRRFIAERVLNNLGRTLDIKDGFRFEIDKDQLLLKSRSSRKKSVLDTISSILGADVNFARRKKDSRDSWDITEMDQVWRDSITAIFPRQVEHYTQSGAKELDDIFDYIEGHFCLANGSATPRTILIFLEKVISISSAYFRDKPGETIALDENGEYPLIKRDHILKAYGTLQETMINMFVSCITNEKWRKMLHHFFSKKGGKVSFSFRHMKKLEKIEEDSETREFLAFLEHLGVMNCTNKSVALEQRMYNIPILLRRNWHAEHANST